MGRTSSFPLCSIKSTIVFESAIASQGDILGFMPSATADVAACLAAPSTVGSWKGIFTRSSRRLMIFLSEEALRLDII